MATRRISLRKILEILKLQWHDGFSNRVIATSSSISPSTGSVLVQRATHAGLSWTSVQEMTDKELEELLYVDVSIRKPAHVMSNWQQIRKDCPGQGLLKYSDGGNTRKSNLTSFSTHIFVIITGSGPSTLMLSCANIIRLAKGFMLIGPAKRLRSIIRLQAKLPQHICL